LLPIATLGGAPLLSFAVALVGAGLAALAVDVGRRVRRRMSARADAGASPPGGASRFRAATTVGAVVAVAAPLVLGAALTPTLPSMDDGPQLTVAAVQGNVPRLGLSFNAQRRAVLDMHVKRTVELAADV